MKLRIASPDDAQIIGEIGYQAFRKFFETDINRHQLLPYIEVAFSKQSIENEFSAKGNIFLLAEKLGKVIGFARLWEEDAEKLKPAKMIKMERLYLVPDEVGTGAGAFLMVESLNYAEKNGFDKIWLQVLRPNKLAISFYNKWGFIEFDTSPAKFEADNEIDLWMERDVSIQE